MVALTLVGGLLLLLGCVLVAWPLVTKSSWPNAGGGALGSQVMCVGGVIGAFGIALTLTHSFLTLLEVLAR